MFIGDPRRPALPIPRRDRARYTRLLEDSSRGSAQEAASGAFPRAREGGAGRLASAQGLSAPGASLQAVVFGLVAATFTTIYITQPVLPVLQAEFGVSESIASLSVSAVILGIALANLPFGVLADRYPIRPIILAGTFVVCAASLVCAVTHQIGLLIGARFVQGLFIPSMSTCLAAYLARSLPPDRLNVVMGSYVSATVAGGLGGRLLGGFIHPPLHWRYAFVSAAALLLAASAAAVRWLPREEAHRESGSGGASFLQLLARPDLLRMLLVAFSAFFVFSAMFNYLPFYLSRPPLSAPIRSVEINKDDGILADFVN